jgi:hypothetical protein
MQQSLHLEKKLAGSTESLDKSASNSLLSSSSGEGWSYSHLEASTPQRPRTHNQTLRPGLHLSASSSGTVTPMPQTRLSKVTIPLQVLVRDSKRITIASPARGIAPWGGSDGHTQQRSRLRRLRLHWLTAYRTLIVLTFVINAVVLSLLIALNLPLGGVLTATAANLLASVIVRQEDVINASFGLVARTPSSWPIGIRRVIGDFHHYGGVHIGCAVSSLLWYILFIVVHTVAFARGGKATGLQWADITTCYLFLLFILFICTTAIPGLRIRFHDSFEHTHRFGGWASLLVLWINAAIRVHTDPTGIPLYAEPSIWLLSVTTLLIILPWLRIRRVPITAERISTREIKLTFPFTDMPYTSTARFSSSPLLQWHAFATIPSPDGKTSSVIISAAGDWTSAIIAHPPLHLWLRYPPASNFLSFALVFNSLLLVATGAGIGPLLSLLTSPTIANMKAKGKRVRVMWCVYDPYAEHWKFVVDAIRAVDAFPRIFDSRDGRPELAFEAQYLMQSEGVEACMCVSNLRVTEEVVSEVQGSGGVAYGAVFDS